MNYIGNCIDEFIRWFSLFNNKYFDGELIEPLFTVQRARENNLGHCTINKIWVYNGNDENKNYEININAAKLHNDINDIAGVVLHECVHLYHLQNGIKDCSGKIHNKKFKNKCEELGFVVEQGKSVGWGYTSIDGELKDFIVNEVKPNSEVFKYARIVLPQTPKEKKKAQHKFMCPECNSVAKAKEDVKLTCSNCNVEMEIQEN